MPDIGRLQAVDLSQVKIYRFFSVVVNGTTLHSKAWKDSAKRNNCAIKFSTPTTTYYGGEIDSFITFNSTYLSIITVFDYSIPNFGLPLEYGR